MDSATNPNQEAPMKTANTPPYGNPLNWWLWTQDGWRVNPAAKHGRKAC
jgi:hypothetical protein